MSFETVEHIRADMRLLRNFRDMSPRLIASVPNQDRRPYSRSAFPFHERHYTPAEFETLLSNAGWTVTGWYSQPGKAEETIVPGTDGLTLIAVAE